MEIEKNGEKHILKGVPELTCCPVSVKKLTKLVKQGNLCYMMEWQRKVDISKGEMVTSLKRYLVDLQKEFTDVFSEHIGLPPTRKRDHIITLIPIAKSLNIQPYRYPYA